MPEPATDILQQIVVFCLGNQEFGLEIGRVREIMRLVEVTPMPNVPREVSGMINVRGKIIPVVDLHWYLGLPPTEPGLAARIIVVELESNLIGLAVDAATDVVRVDGISMEPAEEIMPSGSLTSVKGVFKLEERLVTLLDLQDLSNVSSRVDSAEG